MVEDVVIVEEPKEQRPSDLFQEGPMSSDFLRDHCHKESENKKTDY